MIVARWRLDARFGHKQEVIKSLQKWFNEIGSQLGWSPENSRLLTGSVGVEESAVVSEVVVKDLAELNQAWEKLGAIAEHAKWSKELEPHVVSGTNRWEIYQLL